MSRRHRRWVLGTVLAAAALVVTGCGSSSSSDGTPTAGDTSPTAAGSPSAGTGAGQAGLDTSADPCALLTAAQVTKAIGLTANQGTSSSDSLSKSKDCTWTTKFGEGADYNCATDVTSVVLQVVAPPPALAKRFPTAPAYFAQLQTTLKMAYHAPQPVSGIGDEAFDIVTGAGKGLDVYAVSGSTILRVFSDCGAPDQLRPELKTLLGQAVSAL